MSGVWRQRKNNYHIFSSVSKGVRAVMRAMPCPSMKRIRGLVAGAYLMNNFLNHESKRMLLVHPFSENP